MSREWKSGDVAMVLCSDGEWRQAVLVRSVGHGNTWSFANGAYRSAGISEARPLLVIDPRRLGWDQRIPTAAEYRAWVESLPAGEFATGALIIADALEQIPTEIPEPIDEPTDMAARVRDRGEDVWARNGNMWGCLSVSSTPLAWDVLVNLYGPLEVVQ